MCVISAAATTCRRKHSGGQGTPHAMPRFRTAGSHTGPTVLRADAIRMCYEPHGRAARRETRPRYRANNGAENRRAAATAGTPGGAGRDKNDGDAPSQGPKGK